MKHLIFLIGTIIFLATAQQAFAQTWLKKAPSKLKVSQPNKPEYDKCPGYKSVTIVPETIPNSLVIVPKSESESGVINPCIDPKSSQPAKLTGAFLKLPPPASVSIRL